MNQLSPEETAAGWKLLFDGKTFKRWVDPATKHPPGGSWAIEDGTIKALKNPPLPEYLLSASTYENFDLRFEWKVGSGGNSGLKYRLEDILFMDEGKYGKEPFEEKVTKELATRTSYRGKLSPTSKPKEYGFGFEYQLIDNAGHADAKRGPLYQAGGLYGMVAPASGADKPAGEWNQSRISIRGTRVEHWLNGVKVVEADLKGPEVKQAVEKRWKASQAVQDMFLRSTRPRWPIALQNHGDEAWFRNIKILELTSRPD